MGRRSQPGDSSPGVSGQSARLLVKTPIKGLTIFLSLMSLLLAGCSALDTLRSPAVTPLSGAQAALTASAEAVTQTPEPAATLAPALIATVPAAATAREAAPTLAPETPLSGAQAAVTPEPSRPSATLNPDLALKPAPTDLPTPDPELRVGAVVYEDDFDGKQGWTWPYAEDDVAAFSLGGNRLNAVMKVGNVGGPRLVGGQPALQIGDQQLQVTSLANMCYARDEYGVLFRGNANATDGYVFMLNCEGRARVVALQDLRPAVLVDWTASRAIMPGAPAENTLMVWAEGSQFHFFVNGKFLFSVFDKTFAQGTHGFYIYDRTDGGESVSFDHLVVRAVSPP